MAETTIEWADYTHNHWMGCTHVSEGCRNCYAEAMMDTRLKKVPWGPNKPRVLTSEANRKKPLSWNRKAAKAGVRPRVFCASLADWLDEEVPVAWVVDLLELIHATPNLDWLLLSKRVDAWRARMEVAQLEASQMASGVAIDLARWLDGDPPANVWMGTSVESQAVADKRVPALLEIPAAVRFLSCEPLLGSVDLDVVARPERFHRSPWGWHNWWPRELHWVIVGGESGKDARPMHPDWARNLRDQCAEAGVAYFHKQNGEWMYFSDPSAFTAGECVVLSPDGETLGAGYDDGVNSAGMVSHDWESRGGVWLGKVGKKQAGRLLDGVECNAFPEVEMPQKHAEGTKGVCDG